MCIEKIEINPYIVELNKDNYLYMDQGCWRTPYVFDQHTCRVLPPSNLK